MLRYSAKQLLNMALTLFAVSFLVFALNELSPGDVARKILGPYASQSQVDHLTLQMGLDRPAIVRYFEYMGKALTGDFGDSIVFRQPVSALMWDRLGNTLLLAAISFAVIVPLSVVLGVLAGMRERGWFDRSVSVFSSMCASIPIRHGRVPARHLRGLARLASRYLAAPLRLRLGGLDAIRAAGTGRDFL